ncbi:isoleucine--tRNA ligase [Deinococcus peraridilitoris]|uniref:Isoleucine--tRNA ligase n=1 Tax=Deinococcus peraridilitoris (strain DSM 19664 / LMG 22246 / CIP 109416 / KR-200) TaxID=937777 RepID=L0A7U2_DEIPD|nr:isoleucine--tRNA ligase [Deinococcus peraridilitoris]AFZ69105.1 isoleucyl-tRNA synthetase [Deinococcus peraridilitoris DSM 19664]
MSQKTADTNAPRTGGALFQDVASQPNFRELERGILEFWKERDIFARSVRQGGPEFVFYEGPPTANGQPALHHVLARSFKDLFPRFRSMQGYHVTRKGGWDTHGLPVEISVEKKLGLQGRNHGASREELEEFNRLCRESVWTTIQDWNYFTERLGYWVDLEGAYITYRNAYIESVWNLLRRLWDRGLITQDYKVVPLSPRISTTLSKAELGEEDSYKEVDDPSVYVRFPLKLDTTPSAVREALTSQGVDLEALDGLALVVWTTTPWTLPSNTMAAVNPELTYAVCSSPVGPVIVAEEAVERLSSLRPKEEALSVLATLRGRDMEFWGYSQPFPDVVKELGVEGRMHFVALAEFVSAQDGSGVAHEAPVYGAEDLELSRAYGTPMVFGTDDHGIMQVTHERGQFFKDADKGLIRDLKERGLMYWAGTFRHRYPFHDRTGDPILYFAKPSWYVRTQQMASKLVEQNEKINWVPGNIKHGRFGKWLEGNVDWAISRERYWGTPLPFWVSEDGSDYVCVSSVKELSALAGRDLSELDLHRPYIDDITFERGGQLYRRVPEVLDVWFDSGSMPYAQWHLLLDGGVATSGAAEFERHFPADFICEAIDQTRGWFYSLHTISTLLYDSPAYKNVICLGHIVDEFGKKMSKSKGNVVQPIPLFDAYGADSVRWYMFTASEPGDQKRFSERLVGEAQRNYVNTLWNVYSFFTLYANIDAPRLNEAPPLPERPEIDRWLVSRLEETIRDVTASLETYDARGGARALERFVEELSNWYVRRNRRRFWRGGENQERADSLAAYATLHEALVTISKLSAPFTPFLADALYRNLALSQGAGAPESVHLCDWPVFNAARFDEGLVREMAAVLKVVDLGRAVRGQHNLKTRQPLQRVLLRARSADETAALGRFREQISEELNVKEVELLDQYASVVRYTLRPNLPVVGKQYGKQIPLLRQALAEADSAAVARSVRDGLNFTVNAGEATFELSPDGVLVDAQSPEGLAAAEDAGYLVAFDTALTRALVLEGLARDLVRGVQDARKKAGFAVSDRIELSLQLEGDAREAAQAWRELIAAETLAEQLSLTNEPPASSEYTSEVEGGSAHLRRI